MSNRITYFLPSASAIYFEDEPEPKPVKVKGRWTNLSTGHHCVTVELDGGIWCLTFGDRRSMCGIELYRCFINSRLIRTLPR